MDIVYQEVTLVFKNMEDIDYAIKVYFEKKGFEIVATYYKNEKNWGISVDSDIVDTIDVVSKDPLIDFLINLVEKSTAHNEFGEFIVKKSPLRVRLLTKFGPNAFQ